MALVGLSCTVCLLIVWTIANRVLEQPVEQRLLAGRAALVDRRLDDAWQIARALERDGRQRVDVWTFYADAAEAASQPDAAVEAMQQLAALKPADSAEWLTRIAAIEMKRYRVGAAETALSAALRQRPDLPAAWRLKVQLLSVQGRSQELARALLQLIRLKRFTSGDLAVLAAADPFVADEEVLAQVERATPDHPPRLARARIAINDDHLDDAIALLAAVGRDSPEYEEAQGLLGKLFAERDGAEFQAWHRKLSPDADESSRIWLARGIWLKRQGELESAARCLWEAVRREPELSAAITNLSQTLRMKGEHEASAAFSARADLLQRIRDLATRIDEQQDFRRVPQLITSLTQAGRIWEAWAWSSVLARQQPNNTKLARQVASFGRRLGRGVPRTLEDAIPCRQLNWSHVPLPDWSRYVPEDQNPAGEPVAKTLSFEDEAIERGLGFIFQNSDDPQVPGRYIFESTGGGVGVLDFDQDGWPDIYFPQAGPWPVDPSNAPRDFLYRNRGGERFEAVTDQAGIAETGYSQGVSVGDYDSDGFDDVYVANIGRNTLLRNNGDGTFEDVSPSAVRDDLWTVSAAFADFNGDGLADLFDVNYLERGDSFTLTCRNEKGEPRVCRPTLFEPALDSLLINQGDGTFATFQDAVGLNLQYGMGLGLVVGDFNNDGRPDVFVANDQTPNYLLLNHPHDAPPGLKFEDQGMLLGVGLDQDGFAQASMGIAHGDVNHDGRLDLFVTNFSQESNALYLSDSDGGFRDATREAGLRAPGFAMLGFGTQLFDADSDGELDLLVLNGHIDDFSHQQQEYRMRPQLFQGQANAKFVEITDAGGVWLGAPRLGRGLATLDWNGDGRIDFVASDLEGPVLLGTNTTNPAGRSYRFQLIGTKSARNAVGSRAIVRLASGAAHILHSCSGDGYESANERVLVIGVPNEDAVAEVDVLWKEGDRSTYSIPTDDRSWILIEGRDVPVRLR